jgi:hypothetical protein
MSNKYCNMFKIVTPSMFYNEVNNGDYCVCIIQFRPNTEQVVFDVLIKTILDQKNIEEYKDDLLLTKLEPLKYLFSFKKFKDIQYDDVFISNIIRGRQIEQYIDSIKSTYLI